MQIRANVPGDLFPPSYTRNSYLTNLSTNCLIHAG